MSDTSEMVHPVRQVPEAAWSQLESAERKPHRMTMKRLNRDSIRTQILVLLPLVMKRYRRAAPKTNPVNVAEPSEGLDPIRFTSSITCTYNNNSPKNKQTNQIKQ